MNVVWSTRLKLGILLLITCGVALLRVFLSPDRCIVPDSEYYILTAERFKAGLGPTIILDSGEVVYNSIWPLGYPTAILIGLYAGFSGVWASKLVNVFALLWIVYELKKVWSKRAPILALSLLALTKVWAFSWAEPLMMAFTLALVHAVWQSFHQRPTPFWWFWIFFTGFGMFFTKYIGGVSVGIVGFASLYAFYLRRTKVGWRLLLISLLLFVSFIIYFYFNQRFSHQVWGGPRFLPVEPWSVWIRMVLSALLNEVLLIRDWDNFHSLDTIGLLGGIFQAFVVYKIIRIQKVTPENPDRSLLPLAHWYLVTALILGITLIGLRAFSPFDPLDIRLLSPSTFFLLIFGLSTFASYPILWSKIRKLIFLIFALSSICALLPKKFNPLKPLEKLYRPTTKLYLLLVLLGILSPFLSIAQTFGNEWINYQQSYFKIPIAKAGVYRLSVDQLKKAGFNTNANPQSIQLFWRGKEQAIFVQGQDDQKLDANDYVEFYAEGNDGAPDSLLYIPSSAQPHPYFSLYSDSTAYFLTHTLDGKPGKRMQSYQDTDFQSLTPESFHLEEVLKVYTNEYPVGFARPVGTLSGAMLYSHYDYGEGWTGPLRNINEEWKETLTFTNLVRTASIKPRLEWLITGRLPDKHRIAFSVGDNSRSLGEGFFDYYYSQRFNFPVEFSDVSIANQNLVAKAVSKGVNGSDRDSYSVAYIKAVFPQATTMMGLATKTFYLQPQAAGRSFLSISGADNTSLQAYDITDKDEVRRIGGVFNGTTLQTIVRQSNTSRRVMVTREFKTVSVIAPVQFRAINPQAHDYLIITHPALQKPASGQSDPVRTYASYRASEAGGSYDTLTVQIFQLYDQFNYGETSPLAIRRFLDFMLRKGNPKSVFLIGQSRDPQGQRFNANRNNVDMIPSSGWPGSDITLTMGLNGKGTYEPAIPIGRLQTNSPQTVLDYLAKVKEHESKPMSELWKKNILHLSGGQNVGEQASFKANLASLQQTAQTKLLGTRVEALSKKTDDPVEFLNIHEQVNKGLSMITFFGHSSSTVSDIDIGFCSNDLLGYRNSGKYPFMYVNGCGSGNFYLANQQTFGTDWVNTPNRGAILFLATTDIGYPSVLREYASLLYNGLFADSTLFSKPFGYIQQQVVKRFLANNSDFYHIAHAEQFTLQGDPAVVMFPAAKPDYAVTNSGLFLKGFDGKEVVASADSFRVGMVVSNLGRNLVKPFTISLKRTLSNGREIDLGSRRYAPVAYQDTLYFTVTNAANSGGTNRFDVTIDAANQIDELNKQNNKAFISLALPGSLARPVLPHDFAIVGTQENGAPTARLMAEYTPTNASVTAGNILFELDTSAAFTSTFKKTTTLPSSNAEGWKVALLASDSTVYYWRVRDADQAVSGTNQWSTYSFTYIKGVEDGWAQSQSNQFENVLTDQVLLRNGRWDFSGSATSGVLTSSLIGPTTRWGAIRQQVTKNAQQKSSLDVYGVDARGNETLLINNLTSTLIDISKIDARQYPYLRLREKISGPTAPQLKRWLVSYQGVPEGALYVQGRTSYLSTLPLTLEEGASFTQALNFNVLSTATFTDSLLVTETLTNAAASVTTTKQYRVAAAKSIPLSLTYRNLQAGENRLSISVNPQVLPEVSYTNNTVTFALNVQADRTAPTLEVTFDGRTIREGDYVSANPVIVVRVKDSNKYAIKKDTVGIDLYWQKPEGALQRLSYKNPAMKWDTLAGNEVRVTYQPKNLAEGTYFFQAQGSDVAGNNAGALPYAIRFQVKAETGLQQFLVSPNPLELYTRFHLVLTGDSLPDAMTVEIMSMQGQLLRVLSNESQPLRVGTNEYFWNGTDHQGNRLPPGTYIYRLKLSQNGQTYPIIDPAFKATGRVVIVR